VQTELRRVGCFTGSADGEWNKASRRSLELFNKSAGTKLDVRLASLDAIKSKARASLSAESAKPVSRPMANAASRLLAPPARPQQRQRMRKRKLRESPSARRDRDERPARLVRERPQGEASATGQVVCDPRRLPPGRPRCHLDSESTRQGGRLKAAAATCRFAIGVRHSGMRHRTRVYPEFGNIHCPSRHSRLGCAGPESILPAVVWIPARSFSTRAPE